MTIKTKQASYRVEGNGIYHIYKESDNAYTHEATIKANSARNAVELHEIFESDDEGILNY